MYKRYIHGDHTLSDAGWEGWGEGMKGVEGLDGWWQGLKLMVGDALSSLFL